MCYRVSMKIIAALILSLFVFAPTTFALERSADEYQKETEALLAKVYEAQEAVGEAKNLKQYVRIVSISEDEVVIKHKNLRKGWEVSVVNQTVGAQHEVVEGTLRRSTGTTVFKTKTPAVGGYYSVAAMRDHLLTTKKVTGPLYKHEAEGSSVSVSLIASKSLVTKGSTVTLSWTSKNAESCRIQGATVTNGRRDDYENVQSKLDTKGSFDVVIAKPMVYALTCSGNGMSQFDFTPVSVK